MGRHARVSPVGRRQVVGGVGGRVVGGTFAAADGPGDGGAEHEDDADTDDAGDGAGEAGVLDAAGLVVRERRPGRAVLVGLLGDALVLGNALEAVGLGGGVEAEDPGEDQRGSQADQPPAGARLGPVSS